VVVIATPCDLAALIDIRKPVVRAGYDYAETGDPSLRTVVNEFLGRAGLAGAKA
jgi:predicted GTPase